MHDRLEAFEVRRLDVAHVDAQPRALRVVRTEVAPVVIARVEPDDLVPELGEDRAEHRADVTRAACDENPHATPPGTSVSLRATNASA